MITLYKIGQRIKKRRKELKMSQWELSDLIGFGISYISLIEAGKRNLDLIVFLNICYVLKIDAKEMLSDETNQAP
jgi:transcriptional regulator with XRE-family HTH domain